MPLRIGQEVQEMLRRPPSAATPRPLANYRLARQILANREATD